jgi:hypothetical protein
MIMRASLGGQDCLGGRRARCGRRRTGQCQPVRGPIANLSIHHSRSSSNPTEQRTAPARSCIAPTGRCLAQDVRRRNRVALCALTRHSPRMGHRTPTGARNPNCGCEPACARARYCIPTESSSAGRRRGPEPVDDRTASPPPSPLNKFFRRTVANSARWSPSAEMLPGNR